MTLYNRKNKQYQQPSVDNIYLPKTINQEKYVKYLSDDNIKILFCLGPAGTGKTLFACNEAIKNLKENKISRIILTRPVVAVEDEQIGFLPGSLVKKMDPWVRPIMDIFNEYYTTKEITEMINLNIIEISPLAYMRGRTFKNSIIIADEMQNSSPNQMLMLTTRLGDNCKMVVTGDLNQSDKYNNNGLNDFIKKFNIYKYLNIDNIDGIEFIEMKSVDVERSKVVKQVLQIYEFNKLDPNNPNKLLKLQAKRETPPILVPVENDAALIPREYNRSLNLK